MRLFRVFIVLIFTSMSLLAQQMGSWRNYSDMSSVQYAVCDSQMVWVASEGGAYYFQIDNTSDIHSFTKSNGLSSQSLSALALDKNGKIWLGSNEGIIDIYSPSSNAFDRILDISKTDYINKRINHILPHNNFLYVATDFGLSVVDINTMNIRETAVKFGSLPSGTKVISSCMGKSLYVATEYGIAILKENSTNLSAPESWTSFLSSDLSVGKIAKIIEWNDKILAATEKGIIEFKNNNWQSFSTLREAISDITVFNDELYALENSILYSVTSDKATELLNLSGPEISKIHPINKQCYALSTNDGLYLIKNETTPQRIIPEGPSSNFFIQMDTDKKNNLWISTGKDVFGSGIMKFNGTDWEDLDKSNTPAFKSNAMYSVFVSSDDEKYFGNWGRGFYKFTSDSVYTYDASTTEIRGVDENPDFVVITAIAEDSYGNIWVANSENGEGKPLSVLTSSNHLINYQMPSNIISPNSGIHSLVIDHNNTKWFVAYGEGTPGLYYFNDNNSLENISNDTWGIVTSISNSITITSLAVDNRGELWIGTSSGLKYIPNTTKPNSIQSVYASGQQSISCLIVDPTNRKWVGTHQGLYLYSEDGTDILEHYSTLNSPLPTDDIKSLAINEQTGELFIGTDLGLAIFQTPSVKPKEGFEKITVYPSPFVLNGSNSARVTIDGLIKDSQIKILTLSGKLIKEIESPGGRIAFWDGKDESGKFVSSGVYFIVAYDNEGSEVKTAKIAVIRK